MTATQPNRRPRLRAWLLTLLLGAGLAGLLLLVRDPVLQRLAEAWQRQLDTLPPEELPLAVEQLATLGDAALPSLVTALGSSHEATARAAKQTLVDELQRWKSLEPDAYQPKLERLAHSLAEQVGNFGPTARCDAAELALRILREYPAAARGAILASCELVVRATTVERQLLVEQAQEARLDPVPGSPAASDGPLIVAATPAWTRPEELSKPAASSPADKGVPTELASVPGARPSDPAENAPERLPAVPEAHPLRPNLPETPLPSLPAPRMRAEAPPAKAEVNKAAALTDRLAGLDTVTLMRQLQLGNARQVEAELRQRGFNAVQLELARQMFDADPQVRRALAERLPGLQSINAVPWLLELCRDEDGEVRWRAVSLLATTDDPKLRAEAERLARLDSDPRVKEQAERIAKQGRKTLR